jgi:hypothetical protein
MSSKRLTRESINQNVVAAKYAVRGELAVRSEEFRAQLLKGNPNNLPFSQVISANIGNPQQLGQKPITFFRQVCSILENPDLLKSEDALVNQLGYKTDVIERAKTLLKHCQSVGAYSASAGVPQIKESVAAFLESESERWLREVLLTVAFPRTNHSLLPPQGEMASPPTPTTYTCPVAPRPASTLCSTSFAPTPPAAS